MFMIMKLSEYYFSGILTLFMMMSLGWGSQTVSAQIEGEALFGEPQIVTIELGFGEVDFWGQLVENYEADENEYIPADLFITDNTGTTVIPLVGVRLKGNSSYNHPGDKKAFKIDLNEYVVGQNYDGLKKINFSNCFKDPTFIREKLYTDLCQEAGVPAPRANYANVYFNGEFWGFYTMVEQIDDQFLDWRILDDGGNLFKAGDNFDSSEGAADLMYYGDDQSSYLNRYELKSNETTNDWSDLIEFISFLNTASPAEYAAEIDNRLETTEYFRSAAMDNIFGNLDTYTLSARNYYFYHNQTTGKWEWIKWDSNECFGLYGGGGGPGGPGGGGVDMETLDYDYHADDRPLLERIFLSSELTDQYLTEYCQVIDELLNPETLFPKIDALRDFIQADVYADDNKMYDNADFDTNIESDLAGGPGPGGGGAPGLKSFAQARYDYLSEEIDCSLYTSVEEVAAETLLALSPNPAQDQFQLQSEELIDEILITNVLGQECLRLSIGASSSQIDASVLAPGIYQLSTYAKGDLQAQLRLMIQR